MSPANGRMYLICQVTSQEYVIKGSWTLLVELLAVCHHFSKIVNDRHFDSGNLMLSICHVTSRKHLLKWTCDFVGGSLSP